MDLLIASIATVKYSIYDETFVKKCTNSTKNIIYLILNTFPKFSNTSFGRLWCKAFLQWDKSACKLIMTLHNEDLIQKG